MRRIGLALALLFGCLACDDSTGPGSGPPPWGEVELPAELGEGFVADLTTGADRIVALARTGGEEWVLELQGDGAWEVLLDRPLPVPIPPVAGPDRAVPFPGYAQDLVVDGEGIVYAVGGIPAGIPVGPSSFVPSIWAEADTGWVLHQAPEPGGALTQAAASGVAGFMALGPGVGTEFVTFEGVPGRDPRWSTVEVENIEGVDILMDAMVVHRGDVFAGGAVVHPEFTPQIDGLFLALRGPGARELEPPCGECPWLQIHDIEPVGDELYWAGTISRPRDAQDPVGERRGWLARYDPGRDAWFEEQLPEELQSIEDVLVTSTGVVYIAGETDRPGVFRWSGAFLNPESVPEGSTIFSLVESPSRRLLGAGAFGWGESRSDPLIIERGH